MNAELAHVYREASRHLEAIAAMFKPGMKVTLVVRRPDEPEQELLLSDDSLDEVIAAVRRRQVGAAQIGVAL